jgi:hypothetical protein
MKFYKTGGAPVDNSLEVSWLLYCDMTPESCNLHICLAGVTEHVPVATGKASLLDGELLEHVSTATNTTEEAMHCIQGHVSIPRQCIQKRFRSHGNEPPKNSNGRAQ